MSSIAASNADYVEESESWVCKPCVETIACCKREFEEQSMLQNVFFLRVRAAKKVQRAFRMQHAIQIFKRMRRGIVRAQAAARGAHSRLVFFKCFAKNYRAFTFRVVGLEVVGREQLQNGHVCLTAVLRTTDGQHISNVEVMRLHKENVEFAIVTSEAANIRGGGKNGYLPEAGEISNLTLSFIDQKEASVKVCANALTELVLTATAKKISSEAGAQYSDDVDYYTEPGEYLWRTSLDLRGVLLNSRSVVCNNLELRLVQSSNSASGIAGLLEYQRKLAANPTAQISIVLEPYSRLLSHCGFIRLAMSGRIRTQKRFLVLADGVLNLLLHPGDLKLKQSRTISLSTILRCLSGGILEVKFSGHPVLAFTCSDAVMLKAWEVRLRLAIAAANIPQV
jgi:hypothetical protein